MDKRNIFVTGFSILVAASIVSCQKGGPNGSDVKTLDQMASGSGSYYSCAAGDKAPANSYVSSTAMQHVLIVDKSDPTKSSKCSESQNANDPLCKAMKDVLNVIAAKSDILVKNYFDTIKGNILLSNLAVETLCQSSFKNPDSPQFVKDEVRKKIDGCWSIPKLSEGVYAVTMNHKADATSIRANGIRVFGMFYGQAVQQMSMANGKFSYDPNYDDKTVRKTLWDHKNDLATKFLLDVRAGEASGKYSLAHLPYLTVAGIGKIRSATVTAIDASLFDNNAVSQQRFVDTVMGEAFDSGFCQASQTSVANATTFKNTMTAFNDQILPGLNQLASAMGTAASNVQQPADASQPANGSANNGFGLGAFDSFGGFFSSLATIMTSGGMLGNGAGYNSATQASAVQQLNLLAQNPNNSNLAPYTQYYNPALPSNTPGAANYDPTLFAQRVALLRQQASTPASGYGTTANPYATTANPYGAASPVLAQNPLAGAMGSGGLLSMFSSMNSSNVCPYGNCSLASGGCSCSKSTPTASGAGGSCQGGCSNC